MCDVTRDPYPPLSQTVTLSQAPFPWSVTYFMDGYYISAFWGEKHVQECIYA